MFWANKIVLNFVFVGNYLCILTFKKEGTCEEFRYCQLEHLTCLFAIAIFARVCITQKIQILEWF